uniref:DYW domain-containing protein n=1 Tax=Gossypium raimondii TaxID=29730 RepID=A0A0D2STP9_GOSRA|nr:hypothetical protein B456_010G158200 [Gossypium raimondii]
MTIKIPRVVNGFESNEYVGNSLVIFVVSWNALFSCYVQSDYLGEAVELFHEMVLSGIRPNEFSLSSMINACTGLVDRGEGRKIRGFLIKLDMYAKIGNLEDAVVFEEITKPDIVSWNALIAGCILHDKHDFSLELGRQLHCNLIKLNVGSDPFVHVRLIDMFSKSGLMNDVRMVFNLMPDKDLIAWNAIISAHSQNGEDMEAVLLFPLMHEEGVGFNQTTLSTILKSIASLQANYVCKQVRALSAKSGFESDRYVVNSLIDGYGKCALLEDATRMFSECLIVGLVGFTSMITAYSQSGQGEEGLKLYLEMLDRGIEPDPYVCSSLLNACANLSTYEQGKQVHVHVLKHGYMHDIFAGNSLINMYAKCGSIYDAERAFSSIPERNTQHGHGKEAVRVFNQMLRYCASPNHITSVSVLCACNHGDRQRAAEMLSTLEPEKSIPMFFLLTLAKMRRLMKDCNVKKEPGRVGDQSHVRSEEIYAKLDELSERLSKARYIPKVEFDLHDVERDEKEKLLYHHRAPIRIKKNLRVCVDCHTAFKFIIKIVSREIILRDINRYHHLKMIHA